MLVNQYSHYDGYILLAINIINFIRPVNNIIINNNNNIKNLTELEQIDNLDNFITGTQSDSVADTSLVDIKDKLTLQEDGRCTNAFKLISDKEILKAAYNKLKSKPGMMTKGSDEETLDGIDHKWFEECSRLLKTERYQPKPARREFIPKANGKKRPLGISSPLDRIVQQAMKMVIESKIEPTFLDCSHGFRPKRSCHSALKEIRNWKGVSWFIEGDIKSFFDNIDHQILATLLKNHFSDTQLNNTYWKFVKAGYIEWDHRKYKYAPSEVGVPQGGIISPILSNLILHELDKHVSEIIAKFENLRDGQKKSLMNPMYMKATRRVKTLKKQLTMQKKGSIEYKNIKKEIRRAIVIQHHLNSTVPHPKLHPTIRYVRYADDWIIGVWGSKKFSLQVKENVKNKLESLKLTLSEEKTLVTNARSEMAHFLGVNIKKIASNRGTIFAKGTKRRRRIPSGNIWLTMPISSIIAKLEKKGFLEGGAGEWKIKSIWKFLALPMRDIILRYRAIYNGFDNYYSFVDNRKLMSKVYWILKVSLRKTLCRKFEMSKYMLIDKYGPDFNCNYKTSNGVDRAVDFHYPKPIREPMNFKVGSYTFRDPLYAGLWTVRTISNIWELCASCGSDTKVEMHHLKHIRTINLKLNSFDQMLAKINRKQVPLCSACHHQVHSGNYQGLSLKYLKKTKKTKLIKNNKLDESLTVSVS